MLLVLPSESSTSGKEEAEDLPQPCDNQADPILCRTFTSREHIIVSSADELPPKRARTRMDKRKARIRHNFRPICPAPIPYDVDAPDAFDGPQTPPGEPPPDRWSPHTPPGSPPPDCWGPRTPSGTPPE